MNCRGLYSFKDAGHNWNLASFPVPFGGGCGLTFGPGGKDLYRAVREVFTILPTKVFIGILFPYLPVVLEYMQIHL